MSEGSIPGLALGVLRAGESVEIRAYGMANLEHMVPVTPSSVFKLASITKTFIATAVMLLVEQGAARLEDGVTEHLPGLPESWGRITLRHLLSHTSGIRKYEPLLPDPWQPESTYAEVVRRLAEFPLVFPTGEQWSYCNSNYIVLGVIIEQVSGRPFRDFVRAQVLLPLGMTDTRWHDPGEIVPNRAQGYAWEGETLHSPGQPPLRNREKPPVVWDFADGGLLSTVPDLAKWVAALATEKLLRGETLAQMWRPATIEDGTAVEYGLGWIVKVVQGRRRVGHWGRVPGFMAELSHFVDDRLTIIVLCNRWKAEIAGLIDRIAGLYLR
jgi:CubicO group peptidase (beta-lactamase class C family)